MSTKNILLPAAIALAFGAGTAQAYLVSFDGEAPAKQIAGFDPQPGNFITRCAATAGNCSNINTFATGNIAETFGHSALSSANFSNSAGKNVNFFLPGEWTLVFGLTESVGIDAGNPLLGHFSVIDPVTKTDGAKTANFFELYYDASSNSDMLAGTGFNDGTKILSGTIDSAAASPGFGTANLLTDLTQSILDQFSGNDYPGLTTVGVDGNIKLKLTPTFRNSAFFIDPITTVTMTASSQINLPFGQQNPSGCFVQAPGGVAPNLGGAGFSTSTVGCGNTIGSFNGVDGPNIMFQSDANVAISSVPEPTTLALLGGALLAVGAIRRSRKSA